MKILTPNLASLGRASELVESLPLTQGVEIPDTMLPVIALRAALQPLATVTDPQRVSFGNQDFLVQGASAAALARRIATFGRGLWDVQVGSSAVFNFSLLVGNLGDVRVELVAPNGSVFDLMSFLAFNGAPSQAYWSGIVLFAEDGWALWHEAIATGVGQQIRALTHVSASRLN